MGNELIKKIKQELKEKVIAVEEKSSKRIYVEINPEDIKQVTDFIFNKLNLRFMTATGIDTFKDFEIYYHFSFDKEGKIISVKTLLDKKEPKINSITGLFKAAEWIEREMYELLGIDFIGHPRLERLLLSENWPEGKYPLRKEEN